MKKLLLVLTFLLFLPLSTHAQVYENFPYNFKISLPDNWQKTINQETYFPIFTQIEYPGQIGAITVHCGNPQEEVARDMPNNFNYLIEAKKDYILGLLIAKLLEEQPDAIVTYSKNIIFNDHQAMVINYHYTYDEGQGAVKVNGYWTVFVKDSLYYSFKLQTQDSSGKHKRDFFQLCESFDFLH